MERAKYLKAVQYSGACISPLYSVSYHGENCIPSAYRLSFKDKEIVHEGILISKKKESMHVPLSEIEGAIFEKKEEAEEKERFVIPLSSIPKRAFQYKEFWFVPAFSFPDKEEERREKNLAPLNFYLCIDLDLGYFPVSFSSTAKRYGIYSKADFVSASKKCKENIFYCPQREKYYYPSDDGLYQYIGPTELKDGKSNSAQWMSIA